MTSDSAANRSCRNTVVVLITGGKDITGEFDLGSIKDSTSATRGPEGKGFDESLGVSAKDLDRLANELLAHGRK